MFRTIEEQEALNEYYNELNNEDDDFDANEINDEVDGEAQF